MKFCFCPLYEKDKEEVLQNSKVPPIFSISNFNEKIMNGLYENLGEDLKIISTRTIASYPRYRKIVNRTIKYNFKMNSCVEIGFINLPIIKYFSEFINLFKQLEKWYLENQEESNLYICSYGRRVSHALAINKLKKKYSKVKTAMIFGDLSGKFATRTNNQNFIVSYYQEVILKFSIKKSLNFDGCIFLTDAMNQALKNKKPYLVVEGLCNKNDLQLNKSHYKNPHNNLIKIVYTGIISKQYGFDTLIDAMSSLDENRYILMLYGIGPMIDEIKTKNYKNVKYMGYLPPNEIKTIQNEADILINPRRNNEEFTKYSFPSKTLEYLVTGNPVITYKLEGIPSEYDPFLFYVEDDSVSSLRSKIMYVGDMGINELLLQKEKVFKFLENEKTENIQCEKIINFFVKL